MKIFKQLTSVLLCITALFTALPVATASAAEIATDDEVSASITADSEVSSYKAGDVVTGKTVCEALGIDDATYLNWLDKHDSDSYYLGTPYKGYDCRNPKGDCSGAYGYADIRGKAFMNCTGFVWHVLYKSGAKKSSIPGMSGWRTFYNNNSISRRYFSSKKEMLNSGYLSKGDIIWMFVNGETANSYNHVGIYYGDGKTDVLWHSSDEGKDNNGNQISGNVQSKIIPKDSNSNLYVVLKATGTGSVTLTKKNGTTEKTLSGSQWKLYKSNGTGIKCSESAGTYTYSGTGTATALNTTSSGKLTISKLPYGNYYLKETKTPSGFSTSANIEFTISSTKKNASVTAYDYQYIKLQLAKSSSNTTITKSNSCYSLKGAVYNIYSDKACTNKVGSITTDSDGYGCYYTDKHPSTGKNTNDSTSAVYYNKKSGRSILLKSGVTYYCKELTAPKGYAKSNTVYKFVNSGVTSSDGAAIYRPSKTSETKVTEMSETPLTDPIPLSITKTGDDGTKLPGAEFTVKYYKGLYNSKSALTGVSAYWSKTFTSRADGEVNIICSLTKTGYFPLGTVTIEETQAPKGYPKAGDEYYLDTTFYIVKIYTDSNGNVKHKWNVGDGKDGKVTNTSTSITLNVTDEEKANDVTFQKISEDGNVSGFKFKLYRYTNGGTLETVKSYNNSTGTYDFTPALSTDYIFKTNSSGYISIKNLDPCDSSGKKYHYVFVEQDVPNNYKTPYLTEDDMQNATVKSDGLYFASGKKVDLASASMFVSYDDTWLDSEHVKTVDSQMVSEYVAHINKLSSHGLTTDDFLYFYDTNGDGVININDSDTLQDAGIGAIKHTITFENYPQPIKLQLTKAGNFGFSNFNSAYSLTGAIYNIYTDADCTDYYGKITTDSDGYGSYGSGTTTNKSNDSRGTAVQGKNAGADVAMGTYYCKEDSAPDGYELDETVYTFVDSGETDSAGNPIYVLDPYGENCVYDEEIFGSVTLKKVDTNGKSVNNSKWKLYDAATGNGIVGLSSISAGATATSQYTCGETTKIGTSSSDGDILKTGDVSTLSIINLPLGSYYLQECSAPTGYALSTEKYEFEITTDNSNNDFSFTAENEPFNVTLQKTDSRTGESLSGTKWSLYTSSGTQVICKGSNGTYTYSRVYTWSGPVDSDEITSLPTDTKGKLVVSKLPAGSYYFKEVGTLTGYMLNVTEYEFTVSNDDPYATVDAENEAYRVVLYKTDGNGDSLAGSKWQLFTSDGKSVNASLTDLNDTDSGTYKYNYAAVSQQSVLTTAEDGTLVVYRLPAGSYYFIESEAPEGYMPYGKKLEFTISDSQSDAVVEVHVSENLTMLADTGAGGVVPFYAAGACFAALAAAFIIYHFKSKKRKENAK